MGHFSASPAAVFLTAVSVFWAGGLAAPSAESDARLEQLAQGSYTFRTLLRGQGIRVSATGAVVTLTGTVGQRYDKMLAQETVAGLPGVKLVHNQIVVAEGQPLECSDPWINLRVAAVLALHKDCHAAEIQVSTVNGLVTLSGSAGSELQKQFITAWAKDIDGVEEVRNRMLIAEPGAPPGRATRPVLDDATISAQVKVALLLHRSTESLATKVITRDGAVTLHGEVDNGVQHDQVTSLVASIQGVLQVNNRMTMKVH